MCAWVERGSACRASGIYLAIVQWQNWRNGGKLAKKLPLSRTVLTWHSGQRLWWFHRNNLWMFWDAWYSTVGFLTTNWSKLLHGRWNRQEGEQPYLLPGESSRTGFSMLENHASGMTRRTSSIIEITHCLCCINAFNQDTESDLKRCSESTIT